MGDQLMPKGLRVPWSVRFFSDWSKHLTIGSTFRLWRNERRLAKGGRAPTGLMRLTNRSWINGDIHIRPAGSDTDTLSEILVKHVYAKLVDAVPSAEYVIDLGANIGLASRLFGTRYPTSRIVSVEPDAENFEMLLKNVAGLVREGRCTPLRRAVWNSHASLTIARPTDASQYDSISVRQGGVGQAVDSVTMVDLLAESGFPRVDILKIDIEGAEVELFQGDVDWLKRVNAIAIEFHDDTRVRSGFDRIMGDFGFDIVDSGRHTVVATRRG
jgi:FkbM family methyltransferase